MADLTCTAEGCESAARMHVKGAGPYCAMHSQRVHRYGDPHLVYNRHRNPRPPIGFVGGTCACDRPYVKPRYRVGPAPLPRTP